MKVNICRRVKLTDYFYAEFKMNSECNIDYAVVLGEIDGYRFDIPVLQRTINADSIEDAIEYRAHNTTIENQYHVSIHERVVEIIPNLYEDNYGLIDDGFSLQAVTKNTESCFLVKSSEEMAGRLNCDKAIVFESVTTGNLAVYTYDKDKFFLGAYRFNKK